MKIFLEGLVFSNFFCGFCATALAFATFYFLGFPFYEFLFFTFIFCATTFFYTRAYIDEKNQEFNPRINWYITNKKFVAVYQGFMLLIITACLFFYFPFFIKNLEKIDWLLALVMASFPLSAVAYYGVSSAFLGEKNIRKIGWLKPFIIGYVWSGMVTSMPIFYLFLDEKILFFWECNHFFLFIENFMFISVIAMLFDIKDYAADSNHQLKTFVVQYGLRKTLFLIIIPLILLGWSCLIAVLLASQKFLLIDFFILSVPYFSLLWVAFELRYRKNIFFYLFLVDGLIILKAVCMVMVT